MLARLLQEFKLLNEGRRRIKYVKIKAAGTFVGNYQPTDGALWSIVLGDRAVGTFQMEMAGYGSTKSACIKISGKLTKCPWNTAPVREIKKWIEQYIRKNEEEIYANGVASC